MSFFFITWQRAAAIKEPLADRLHRRASTSTLTNSSEKCIIALLVSMSFAGSPAPMFMAALRC
ncbi:hypothetical protein C0Q70_06019 [Pomacea canaliculata]|uniref:Uncharacterized protein n=1 Tax=Pomacea canaliculata TaxID=400727 RepID=A0A2T7PMW1_POMCA|nr:hypothetical protein C0Q70_06019 [Pomacea canaliculata]